MCWSCWCAFFAIGVDGSVGYNASETHIMTCWRYWHLRHACYDFWLVPLTHWHRPDIVSLTSEWVVQCGWVSVDGFDTIGVLGVFCLLWSKYGVGVVCSWMGMALKWHRNDFLYLLIIIELEVNEQPHEKGVSYLPASPMLLRKLMLCVCVFLLAPIVRRHFIVKLTAVSCLCFRLMVQFVADHWMAYMDYRRQTCHQGGSRFLMKKLPLAFLGTHYNDCS